MSRELYVKILLSLAKEAGRIALRLIDDSHPGLKPDRSIITDADLAISRLAHRRLGKLVATGRHALIDEEDPRKAEYLNEEFLERIPFIWAIDPIDGTRGYANRMPHYGISIGLIKDRKPWLGAVYFPSLKELFYCDGEQAYFVTDAFGRAAKRRLIKPVNERLSDRSVFILSDAVGEELSWHSNDCRYMVFATAVTEFCWPCIGRGCGSLSRTHLWDVAGSWPIVARAGLKFRSFTTGKTLDRIRVDLFEQHKKSWRFKDHYILSSRKNFSALRRRVKFLKEGV